MSEWRLWWGLERSLDLGSRWVLFEANHRLIWGRLEREARAFLHDLSFDGILPPWGSAGWEVRCDPVSGEEGRVRFRVIVDTVRSWNRPDARFSSAAAEESEETPLELKMEELNFAYRRLGRQISDASRNANSLERVATMRENAVAAMKLEPKLMQEIPAGDRAKFLADFHAGIEDLVADIDKVAAALKAGNNAEAAELLKVLKEDQKQGHEHFRKDKKKK